VPRSAAAGCQQIGSGTDVVEVRGLDAQALGRRTGPSPDGPRTAAGFEKRTAVREDEPGQRSCCASRPVSRDRRVIVGQGHIRGRPASRTRPSGVGQGAASARRPLVVWTTKRCPPSEAQHRYPQSAKVGSAMDTATQVGRCRLRRCSPAGHGNPPRPASLGE